MKKEETKDKEVEIIAKLIEHYIKVHPSASDSLEGITSWWLTSRQESIQKERVLLALDFLINKNLLTRKTRTNGQIIYTASNEKNT